ncbi:hypothetical protein [uncultured Prevotella sp.]|uniref:hypothetical protein n=1 Tax=uncultured Prevotella sp. TaxID=159272 RepID=UPI00258E7B4A|nr:hypothetical protein [uncultured Prevotella sp.]
MKHLRTYFILTIIAFVIASCTDGEQMRQRLAEVQACNQTDTVFSSRWLPTVDSLVDYFDSHGTPNERLMAHYLQGRVYHDMGEAPQAIEEYHRAVECADTTSTDCDYDLLAKVHGQAASLFMEQLMPNEMLEELQKEAYYAQMANDTLHQLVAIAWQHSAYDMLNQPDSSVSVLQYVLGKYQEYGYREDIASTASTLCIYMVERKDFDSARKYIELRNEAMGHQMVVEDSIIVYYLGMYHLEVGNLDSAEQHFRGLLHSQNLNNREAACKGLTSLYQVKAVCDSVAKYSMLSYQIADKRFQISNKEELQNIQALYNYNRNQRLAQERALEASRNRQYLAISLFLGVFISILACFYIFWQRHRKKTEMRHIELEFQHQINMLEQAKYDLEKLKQKEYDALLTQKQEEINEWQQEVEKMRQQTKPQYILDSKIVETDIYQRLQFVVAHPAEKMKKTDWTRLNEMINELLPHFVHRINALYHVSEEDYRICMLIRLNFSLSEICILTGLTPKLLYKRRKFMSKKFFSSDEKPELFDKRIKNIS